MTSARMVAPGHARAMIPTMRARRPRRISELDTDLNMVIVLPVVSAPARDRVRGAASRIPLEVDRLTPGQHPAAIVPLVTVIGRGGGPYPAGRGCALCAQHDG